MSEQKRKPSLDRLCDGSFTQHPSKTALDYGLMRLIPRYRRNRWRLRLLCDRRRLLKTTASFDRRMLRYRLRADHRLAGRGKIMKIHYAVALATFAGFGLGAIAVQGLHAQARPPAYSVAEIDIADQAAYSNYLPKAQAAIKAAGGKILAAGGKITSVEGEPPKSRVVIQQWDSLEKFQAYRNSAAFRELVPIREKVAKFRTFVVEGVPQ
jgi:uncharacterized protein (DUF1330 family)